MSFIPTVTLANFEGPLDLLLHLIQKEEMNVCSLEIKGMITNFLESLLKNQEYSFDHGAEFLGGTSLLLLLKSKKLFPQTKEEEQEEIESYVSILKDILEYCSFKEFSKKLSFMEGKEEQLFSRGVTQDKEVSTLPLHHLSLEQLVQAFETVLKKKAITAPKKIEDHSLLVADFIILLQDTLLIKKGIAFTDYFCLEKGKEELIVSFLALLQMMKEQKVHVTLDGLIMMTGQSP